MISQGQSYHNASTIHVTPTVAALGEMDLTGNLIPHSWYHQLKLPSGHPDLVGITILGEIVYQYRPGVVRDERTGAPLHVFNRFQRDKFCAPLAYFSKKFGLTTDQVRGGLKRLEEGGYIRREYRDIEIAGRRVRGMTFVEPVPERIRAITPPTRSNLPALPGAVTVPPPARPASEGAVSAPPGAVSVPEGAVSIPQGAVQIPPYKDTSKDSPKINTETTTTTPPTPPSANESSWSRCQQSINEIRTTAPDTRPPGSAPATPASKPVITPPALGNTPSATTEEDTPARWAAEAPLLVAPIPPQPATPYAAEAPVSPVEPALPAAVPVAAPANRSPAPTATPAAGPAHEAPPSSEPLPELVFNFFLAGLSGPERNMLCRRLARLPQRLTHALRAAAPVATPADELPTSTVAPVAGPAHEAPPPSEPLPLPELVFDFHLTDLTPAQQAELRQRLARLPQILAQKVLDEYNHAVGRKVPIRSKWGWIEYLIRAALEGRFIPTSDLAERRAAQAPPAAVPVATTAVTAAAPPSRQPSAVWQAHWRELETLVTPGDFDINIRPLRGIEDGQVLWLEAPNHFVADWVKVHLPIIEQVLQPHTVLPIRVRIG